MRREILPRTRTCRATRNICFKVLSSHASAGLRPSEEATGVAGVTGRDADRNVFAAWRASRGGDVAISFGDV